MKKEPKFHLSLPCKDVELTKLFYLNTLGATSGRETSNWIDINLFGVQLTFVQSGVYEFHQKNYKLDSKILPSFHFGVILENLEWQSMYQKLKLATDLYLDKTNFLENKKGEHCSFFVKDPNGYIVEFKKFKDGESVFKV